MKHICKHCSNTCKRIGAVECDKYVYKSLRPKQLEAEIKQAYTSRDYDRANKLQAELDKFFYGDKKVL